MSKTAVVLFNLGGPDRPEAVQPFLFNLFNDPAIIGAPNPIRWLLAKYISSRRAPVAREIYTHLGGSSPLLANTQAQAEALEAALSDLGEVRVFIAMRYWHPMTEEAVTAVAAFDPARVVLLPLYPQFSVTTSGSSIAAWRQVAAVAGLEVETTAVCCYPSDPGFVADVAERLRPALRKAAASGKPRLLFSAHGLPKKIVDRGDPYQWQVERSAAAVVEALGEEDLDWAICYQSRVGPMEWIGPSTEAEIARAGRDQVPVVLMPIAFVSEHSETLVELDIEYRDLAKGCDVPAYLRVETVGVGARFISGLADLVRHSLADGRELCSQTGGRLCPVNWERCPCEQAKEEQDYG
jgi:ferrochelatase